MATIIEPFASRKGRPPIYPWEVWSDGQPRRLSKGEDFQAGLNSFRTMIHRKARDLGMSATTKINVADESIQVQFHNKKK